MFEKIKLIMSNAAKFFWPHIKKMIITASPYVQEACLAAVRVTAIRYQGMLESRIDKQKAHEDAYTIVVNDLMQQGFAIGLDVTEGMIDRGIRAAVEYLESK